MLHRIPRVAALSVAIATGIGIGAAVVASADGGAESTATCTLVNPTPSLTTSSGKVSYSSTLNCEASLPVTTVTSTVTDTVTNTVTETTTASPTSTSSTTTSTPTTTTPTPTTSTSTTTPTSNDWPGPDNTGVPDGTVLTTYTGPMTITTDGTVIDAKIINGDLSIEAKDVKITRSKFVNGSVNNRNGDDVTSFTIEDSTIQIGNRQFRGVWGDRITAKRLDISGGYSGGWCNYCLLEDSWIHSQYYESGWHVSAWRMDHYSTLRHNVLSCDLPVYPDGGCSADMTGYGDFHVVEHNTIDGNLFVANAGASYCAYGGSTPNKPYSTGTNNIVFTNNVWQRGTTGKCGRYGVIASFDPSAPGNVWSGNKWDDGTDLTGPGIKK